jgi:two-component system LytT family response regulator
MMKTIDFSKQKDIKITVKEKNNIRFFEINGITHLKCDGYITAIYFLDFKPIVVSKLLKDFEIELEEYGFIRVNRSTLVNLALVKKYTGGNKRMLEMCQGEQIKVSRRKVFMFKESQLFS